MVLTVTLNPSLDVWLRVPTFRVGAFHRAKDVTCSVGGKGINVSRVIRALGGKTVILTPTGGVHRVNYKIVSQSPRASTEINSPGSRLTGTELRQVGRRLWTLMRRADCVVFSGSVPPGTPGTIYRRWILRARRQRVVSVLDASGELLRLGISARPWLVKPNREEAETLLHTRITSITRAVHAVQALLRRGPRLALLSLGQDGALLGIRATGEMWQAQPPATRVISTVGSGDALLGGFLAAWQRGKPLADALRVGVACGTASAMTPAGAMLYPADVRRLLPRVRLTRLN